jgi:ABC-type phosphate/phosphonate transport system permease subunit
LILNAFRSIPELVWAALLLISAGLGPFVGTLALALHTTGVLGRLFAESIEKRIRIRKEEKRAARQHAATNDVMGKCW